MGVAHWFRILGAPLLALALQGVAAWLFVLTANAAWGPAATLGDGPARQTTLWLFACGGPLAGLILGWGLHATYGRLRLPAALATTLLYLAPLLASGVLTWVLGVCLGWF